MTKQTTSQAKSKRSIVATPEGQLKLREAKAKIIVYDPKKDRDKIITQPLIAEKANVSLSPVERFFGGKPVDIDYAEAIVKVLGLELADVADVSQFESSEIIEKTPQDINIPFKNMIEQKLQEITTNSLMNNDGIHLTLQDIYIPLGLMERKEQPKLKSNLTEQESQLPETEYKITKKYENQEFFTEVLDNENTPKSQGQRIAIIGEAGAGKTTLLQQIANHILANHSDHLILWVSLADLKADEDLEDYLLEKWLKTALGERKGNVSDDAKDKLMEAFKTKTVWLLLDGVDEMGMTNPLSWINSQLEGWIGLAKVVLTCRLNVWDNGKNALTQFDVYKNIDFTDDQVKDFISKWFSHHDLTHLGISLLDELNQAGKERIKDLIKNPLRLTLLCYSWQRRQGKLPETKAALYEWFVDAFYQWKEEYFTTTSAQRKELNHALGELVKQALDQDSSRFRLTHSQIVKVLGEQDEPLFKLALDIGWLNRIGVAEENPDEDVYAFVHPSFQEYFAALSIDNNKFFLDHKQNNPNQGNYRLFENYWKEVVILWLQRPEIAQELKNQLINDWMSFLYSSELDGNIFFFKGLLLLFSCLKEYRNFDPIDSTSFKLYLEIIEMDEEAKDSWGYKIIEALKTFLYNMNSPNIKSEKNTTFCTPVPWELASELGQATKEFATEVINCIDDMKHINSMSKDIIEDQFWFWFFVHWYLGGYLENQLKKIEAQMENENYEYEDDFLIVFMKQLKDYLFEIKKSCCFKTNSIDYTEEQVNILIKLIEKMDNDYIFEILDDPDLLNLICEILSQSNYKNFNNSIKGLLKILPIIDKLGWYEECGDYVLDNITKLLIPEQMSWIIKQLKPVTKNRDFLANEDSIKLITKTVEKLCELYNNVNVYSNHYEEGIYCLARNLCVNKMYQNCYFLLNYNFWYGFSIESTILFHCAQNMTYPEFYEAWHNDNNTIHPEATEITPIGNTSTTETLNQQLIDIPALCQQLNPQPIPINIQPLTAETNPDKLAKGLANRIYKTLNLPKPPINDIYDLEDAIISLKISLNLTQIPLILYNDIPNETLLTLCHQLSEDAAIAIITNQTIEPPLRGFPPNQSNLKQALQTWLDNI